GYSLQLSGPFASSRLRRWPERSLATRCTPVPNLATLLARHATRFVVPAPTRALRSHAGPVRPARAQTRLRAGRNADRATLDDAPRSGGTRPCGRGGPPAHKRPCGRDQRPARGDVVAARCGPLSPSAALGLPRTRVSHSPRGGSRSVE